MISLKIQCRFFILIKRLPHLPYTGIKRNPLKLARGAVCFLKSIAIGLRDDNPGNALALRFRVRYIVFKCHLILNSDYFKVFSNDVELQKFPERRSAIKIKKILCQANSRK
jgi:hypothetical protein